MANIMMTDVCNLNCPYCFANEFVNKDRNEITEEAFEKAVEFIVADGTHTSVGLIGGEPTIHSNFEFFVRKLIQNEKVKTIVVYTNGICLDRFWNIITHPKIRLLINCNSSTDIGIKNYERLCNNLDTLLVEKEFSEYVTLGINMYSENFEYEYIIDLLRKYKMHRVRVSITVPNLEKDRNIDAHGYFLKIKPRLLKFFHELLEHEIIPNFDCNKIPSCLIEEEELKSFSKYFDNDYIKKHINRSNISNQCVQCKPVIDIRQDLVAVRCFGLSENTKQSILDFSGIKELENYYMRTIDAYAFNTIYSSKCLECKDRKVLKCNGGCLAFKIKEIMNIQEYADTKNRMVK